MFADKIYGTRFLYTRRSRNEHLDTRGSRVVLCRCFRSLFLHGREYFSMPRFKKGMVGRRSEYKIRY